LPSNTNGKSFNIPKVSNTKSPKSTKKLGMSYKSPVPGVGGSSTLRTPTPTALPRSTKKLGKSYKSPVNSVIGSRPLQTPKTVSPKSTKKSGKFSSKSPAPRAGNSSSRILRTPKSNLDSVRSYKMTHSSPVSSPNTPPSMSKTNVFREIKNPNVYTDSDDTMILSGLRDRLGPVRDVAGLQDTTQRQPSTSHGTERGKSGAGGQIARQDKRCKTAGKLRRSKSCSDLSSCYGNKRIPLKIRTESEHEEYPDHGLSTVAESTTFLLNTTCTGSKDVKEGSGKISRAGSCSDITLL